MSSVNINFRTDNASFDDSPEEQIDAILLQIKNHLLHGNKAILHDLNGNRVGEIEVGYDNIPASR